MYHICCWSGGVDSTATILLARQFNEPLDEIIFSEVMFDLENNISGENPRHIKFIREVAIPLFESWGYRVTILRADSDYLHSFYRIIERPLIHKEHKGMHFGFPVFGRCGIKRDLKVKPITEYCKRFGDDTIFYHGICADEPKRLVSMHKKPNTISLLEKYDIAHSMAKEICSNNGLLSPVYQFTNRGGCWFCPNSKILEFEDVKKTYPDVWKRFVNLESQPNVAFNKFNPITKITLKDIDNMI